MSDEPKTTICSYCSTGCALSIGAEKIRGAGGYPVNNGKACAKGLNLIEPLVSEFRGTSPLAKTDEGLEPLEWADAAWLFVHRFKAIMEEHGPESVAFLSTGQITTEEMALLGALTKFGMGMIHGDGNTRQCMATSVVAYKQAFGFDAPPFTYADFEESDTLVFIGANPAVAHPIMWNRIRGNKNEPKIIVLDPRKTKTAQAATHHYALQPKSDLALLYAVANLLIERDWVDHEYIHAHTEGFKAFRAHAVEFPLKQAAEQSGLSVEEIEELARLIHEGNRVSFWWTMGVNQGHQGVKTAQAIINLALLTGNMGKPGTGANSITGQCNAMGSRLFSNTSCLLGGHDFTDIRQRRKVAALLNISERRIPDQAGAPYPEIMQRVKDGRIKALWIIGTNPAHSWIDLNGFTEALDNLEFLVVQDIYPNTATAQQADLYLPAAASAEKEGTFINSERRIGHVRKVKEAPGQALSDFDIFKRIGKAWGCGRWIDRWDTPERVFRLLKKVSAGQPCDITGIRDYAHLDEAGGIQWPLPVGQVLESNERRLFADGRFYHKSGKARFVFTEVVEPDVQCSETYPFWLLTGRGSVAQWHTETRTGKVERLRKMAPSELYVELNPADAERLGIEKGDTVSVSSEQGEVSAVAAVEESVAENHIFMPMHYVETNRLTFPSFDPESFQPAYKSGAVSVRKV